MANENKILGQASLTSGATITVYSAPAATEVIVSTAYICNRGSADTTFRLLAAVSAAAVANEQYLYYDTALEANDTFAATVGVTLGALDEVKASTPDGTVSVTLFGVEIT